MLELKRIGSEVYCGDKKLTIISQSSKGDNKEVVIIENLRGSMGQKYTMLSNLVEGINELNIIPKGNYTSEELNELIDLYNQKDDIQEKIDKLEAISKSRQPQKLKTQKDIEKMDRKSLESYMGFLQGILDKKTKVKQKHSKIIEVSLSK